MTERLVHVLKAAYTAPDLAVSDADLLARVAAGTDDAAFELLIRRHADFVWQVCRQVARDHHAAEDAFQATFLALARKAASVREASAAGFLYRVAFRAALKARPRNRIGSLPADLVSHAQTPDQIAATSDLKRVLHAELARLPERYQLPLVMCFLNGLTQSEAATRLGRPVGTLSAQLSRGCDRLRARLIRRGVELPAAGVASLFAVTRAGAVSRTLIHLATDVRAGSVGPPVAGLATSVLISMRYSQMKAILVPVVAMAVAIGGFAWSFGQTAAPPGPEPTAPPPATAPAAPATPKSPTAFGTLMTRLDDVKSKFGEDEWATVLRDMVCLGPDAVPELVVAIDASDDAYRLRCLAFVARGIGDKRVVPALIRAFPKTCVAPASDYGFKARDPELLAFMQKHEHGKSHDDTLYDFGRAYTEFRGTLQKMTGATNGEDELNFVWLGGSPRQQYLQRSQFQRCSERWAKWWEVHGKEYVKDEQYDRVNLAPLAVVPAAPGGKFPRGPMAKVSSWKVNLVLESVREAKGTFVFLDLDTGRMAGLPERLRAAAGQPERLDDIAAWAAAEGFDLMGTEYQSPGDDKPHYVLRGLGLSAWRFDGDRRDSLSKDLLADDPLAGGTRVDGLLLRFDPETGRYDPADTATYRFRTREHGDGALYVGVEVHDNTLKNGGIGPKNNELSPIAFNKGRRLAYTIITGGGDATK